MQDDEDGVGSVAVPSARLREAEPRPRDGAGPRCPPDLDPPYVFWPEVSHVNGVLPCGSLHRAVQPSVGGFPCNGTLCGGARQATPFVAAGARCRTMAPQPVLGRSASVSRRAVARDRRGPSTAPPAPLARFGSGSPAEGPLPRSRAESVESEHAAPGPLV